MGSKRNPKRLTTMNSNEYNLTAQELKNLRETTKYITRTLTELAKAQREGNDEARYRNARSLVGLTQDILQKATSYTWGLGGLTYDDYTLLTRASKETTDPNLAKRLNDQETGKARTKTDN